MSDGMVAYFSKRAQNWADNAPAYRARRIPVLLDLLHIAEGARILDVGCGPGTLEPELLGFRPARILGVDLSIGMIAEAQRRVSDPAVEFRACDVLDVTEDSFDLCIAFNMFPHVVDRAPFLRHCASLLRTGGRFAICHDNSKDHINNLHRSIPPELSQPIPPAFGYQSVLDEWYDVDMCVDAPTYYLLSGIKR